LPRRRRPLPPSPKTLPVPFCATDRVRSGEWKGATGKALRDVVSIGIGGSYLGVEFVAEALRRDSAGGAAAAAEGRRLRFLANVDPVDVARALEGLDPETTLVVVISKTFTTAGEVAHGSTPGHLPSSFPLLCLCKHIQCASVVAVCRCSYRYLPMTPSSPTETMLNARTMRDWLVRSLKGSSGALTEADIVAKHMVAVSTNIPGVRRIYCHCFQAG
jgi:hypothetical protein